MIAAMDEASYIAKQLDLYGLTAQTEPLVRDAAVEIDGRELHIREWGRRTPCPVVFLHGGGGSARDWDAVCAVISSERFCIAVDQRGHGDSDWPADGDYRLTSFVSDLRRLVARCSWDSLHLVGFSMGGANALGSAASLGSQCQSLTLIEAAPRLDEGSAVQRLRARLLTPRRYVSLDAAAGVHRSERTIDLSLAREYQSRRLRRAADGHWELKYDPRLLDDACRESRDDRADLLWDAVPRVRCPVLVIRAGTGSLLSSEAAAELAASFRHGRCVEIEDLRHQIAPQGAPELVATLEEFLGASDAR